MKCRIQTLSGASTKATGNGKRFYIVTDEMSHFYTTSVELLADS